MSFKRTLIIIFALVTIAWAKPMDPVDLNVDISDVSRRILHSKTRMPVTPGPITLLYPKWIPGEHSPSGPVTDLAGIDIRADGQQLRWHRDALDMYAFHCQVPDGISRIDIALDFLAAPPSAKMGFTSSSSSTTQLATINWNHLLLYPKGLPSDELSYRATLIYPKDWNVATALPVKEQSTGRTEFAPVSLTTLIDSPVLCGKYLKKVHLGHDKDPSHWLNIACDSSHGLELDKEMESHLDRLIEETHSLFGWYPYDAYHFLLALSDNIGHFGLEHHASSDNRLPENALTDKNLHLMTGLILSHEFVHAWNGKYRRPADMVTADYHEPKKTSLLWVYEGLTEYLGFVLAVRSGLWSEDDYRDMVAAIADWSQNQRGRSWRSLEDTAVTAQLLYYARPDWSAWRRSADFYDEGLLIWLEVDTIIREESAGERSLDDFCRRFFGPPQGAVSVAPYNLTDILTVLKQSADYDWKRFFEKKVTSVASEAPLNGIARAGWKLSYVDTPSQATKSIEGIFGMISETSSIGVLFGQEGAVLDVIPDKAAHQAGMGPGVKVIGVNNRRWSPERLQHAIEATKDAEQDIHFLVENGDYFASFQLAYRDGLKYPHLTRDESGVDILSNILKPRIEIPQSAEQ